MSSGACLYVVFFVESALLHCLICRYFTISLAFLCALAALASSPATATSPNIVISQVYGGAGCATAGCSQYKNDFVELFNRGSTPQSVSGWSVQYASATGTVAWTVTLLPNVTIQPGQYFLVAQGAGPNGTNALPAPDATGTTAMSATAGKVALLNSVTALNGACPASAAIVDLVGYGPTANCSETSPAPLLSATTADLRASSGCTDTDNNAVDLSVAAPAPRNSSTTAPCAGATPNVNLSVSTNTASETAQTIVTVTATASAAVVGDQTVALAVMGTGITAGDYTLSNTTIAILSGQTTGSVTFTVVDDVLVEGTETAVLTISTPSAGIVLGATVTQSIVITDNDAAGLPNLTVNDVAVNEGNSGTTTFTFTVSLSAPAPAGGVTFDIATANGTATAGSDYAAKSLTAQTIAVGNSTYTFDVLVNGDTLPELDETFFVNISNVTNAVVTDGQGQGTIINDDLYKIHDVQGSGATSPLVGQTVSVEGVVIGVFQGATQLKGFFLQEEDADADADPNTSEGIFVFCNACPTSVAEGQRVRVTGVVSEFNGLTEITSSTVGSVIITDAGNHLAEVTPTVITLPIVGDVNAYYEARESMRVTFADPLIVSEYFELARYGQIVLYQGARPFQYTDGSPPSVAGVTAHADELLRRRVILDDDNNVENAYLNQTAGNQVIYHPRANGGFSVGTQGTDFFRGGDLVSNLTGVLHWSFSGGTSVDAWRIRPTAATPVTFTVANPRPATAPAVGGAIRAAGANMLNYFTTIDSTSSSSSGPCGPSGGQDCRGADSVGELNRQRERAAIVVCTLNADVMALMEMENTTASATVTDLLGAVNTRCGGTTPYAFVNTGGTLGTDAIRVHLIYRAGVVATFGSPLVDLDPIHNRPPTAQTFDVVDANNPAFGKRFTVIANHLKSKGCSGATGADLDTGDGQGCFSDRRTQQASRMLSWVSGTVVPAAGNADVLLLGDFNSYGKEPPVTTLTNGGFTDLAGTLLGTNSYSYLFNGELGHLDYAFASASLAAKVKGVGNWHINADESDLLDYNDEIKDVGESAFEAKPDGSLLSPPRVVFQASTAYRASDHDPVLVGLFDVAATPTIIANPSSTTVLVGATATLTAAATGVPTPTVQWFVSTDGGVTFSSIPGATATTLSFTAQASDNNNQYRATFTNATGSANSSAATLSVNYGPLLNIDNSTATTYDAATDGVLLLRYLLGYRDAALIADARGTGASLRDATQIAAHISANLAAFDVDGDGQTLALTDGLMILRRLLNPTASPADTAATAAITANAKNSARSNENVVRAIDQLKP